MQGKICDVWCSTCSMSLKFDMFDMFDILCLMRLRCLIYLTCLMRLTFFMRLRCLTCLKYFICFQMFDMFDTFDIAAGLSKFARLARSVTRNRSTLLQFSSHMPNTKFDNSKPSQIANVSRNMHMPCTSSRDCLINKQTKEWIIVKVIVQTYKQI